MSRPTTPCCRRPETWPLSMFEQFLPRAILRSSSRSTALPRRSPGQFPGDEARVRRMSIIGEDGSKSVRYDRPPSAATPSTGSPRCTELVKTTILKDFYELWPDRFSNKTNGVTPRRFVGLSNPDCAGCLTRPSARVGWSISKLRPWHRWTTPHSASVGVPSSGRTRRGCRLHQAHTGIVLNPDWLFDVQVKRIHEYKRQHQRPVHHHRLQPDQAEPDLKIAPWAYISRQSRPRLPSPNSSSS